MRRRALLTMAAGAAPAWLGGCARADVQVFADWATARQAVQGLPGGGWQSGTSWDLAQTLHHLAQSIEYSMRGFPDLKPAWFRATLGRAAFAYFDARGRMSHGLTDPIPGAPAIEAGLPLEDAAARLLRALDAFAVYGGELRPHFAYGALDKAAYTRAHLMHLADHWALFRRA